MEVQGDEGRSVCVRRRWEREAGWYEEETGVGANRSARVSSSVGHPINLGESESLTRSKSRWWIESQWTSQRAKRMKGDRRVSFVALLRRPSSHVSLPFST